MKHYFSLLILLLLPCSFAQAEVRMPSLFGPNMVLQRNMPCPVWGWADAEESVTVSICGQEKTVQTDSSGRWTVTLDPLNTGGPFQMKIKGKNDLVLDNVMVGEVWVGSGQSNMQWSISNSFNPQHEIKGATFPNIRLITVPSRSKMTPQDDFQGSWAPCSPETIPNFSAVLYFFGRKLQGELDVPIGLIHCSWGGSSCESWMNRDVLAKTPEFEPILKRRIGFEEKNPAGGDNQQVGYLYNGQLHPIIGYGIRGVVWYQGETNAGRAYQYRSLFPAMIENWRDEWKQGPFPFYWVQLANFRAIQKDPSSSDWAELREAQSMTRSRVNSGEAVIIDIGDAKDIHPKDKQNVGLRLALLALKNDYGKDIACESPRFKSVSFDQDRAVVQFDFAYAGLSAMGSVPTGFTIAGEDEVFHWASATIVDKDTVVVSSPKVAKPVAVRYGWADNPVVNMYNSAKLPMSPFRTDNWKGVTAERQ